jgi:uncharacterized protein YggE
MTRNMGTMAAVLLTLVLLGSPARAQLGSFDAGTVSGMGTVAIERAPQAMRMTVVVSSKGSDLKEALASLKDRLDAAKAQLATLGADKASIKVAAPQLAVEDPNRRRQIEMMMAQRLRAGGRKPAKKEESKPPVSVTASLSAEWPLKAAAGEDLLLASTSLQDKIKAADLAGTKEQMPLSPEEQELADELGAEDLSAMYGGDEEVKPGEPMFIFVTPIAEADREKALAEGFQKAKSRAARLAKAAGAELGALKSLNDSESDASDESYGSPYGGYNRQAYQMMQMMRGARGGLEELAEAIGAQPTNVVYRVTVTASFDLKQP